MPVYPKPFMSIPEIVAMGKSRYLVECDIRSSGGAKFARKSGTGKGKWIIDTAAYAKWEEKQGMIYAREIR